VATHILPHEGEARGWLRRHVHRLTLADIDDLIQEAYARLWLVEFSHIANGRSYLFTVVRNLLIEQARRARIVPMERMGEIDALRIPSEEPGPDRRVNAHQELERLERILGHLPERCRQAFELQKFHSLTQREIAQTMNISEKTVEKHLAVALERVLQALKEDSDAETRQSNSGISGHDVKQSD
jgi:RNA polymerase sigma factor (sigma-70 family)